VSRPERSQRRPWRGFEDPSGVFVHTKGFQRSFVRVEATLGRPDFAMPALSSTDGSSFHPFRFHGSRPQRKTVGCLKEADDAEKPSSRNSIAFHPIRALDSSALSFLSILVLSLGLAMDAMAVSAAKGIAVPKILPRHVGLVAAFFGGFQALMPLVGWGIGASVGRFVDAWAHWIAFGLLGAIGAKMLWEARGQENADSDKGRDVDPFALRIMLVLAIATSIDALAVGVSLPMLKAPIVLTLATIGATTAALSALGLYAGRRFGALLGKRLDVLGGLVLIGLGTKILLEHLRGK